MWTKKEFPTILGYESLGDDVSAKRWTDFRLDELLDIANMNDPNWEPRSNLKTKQDICDFVITQFAYPLKYGMPTDKHYDNWFGGMCCHTISQDYWQTASETLRTLRVNKLTGGLGVGDCEDVSLLFTALFLSKGFFAKECIGQVMDKNGQILGGHGWSLFQDGNRKWRLYEATLSEVPAYPTGYPEVDIDANDWEVGNTIYHAIAKFNKVEYMEWVRSLYPYSKMGIKSKETRAKHEAISRSWGIKTKPMKKLGLLGKLRWKE